MSEGAHHHISPEKKAERIEKIVGVLGSVLSSKDKTKQWVLSATDKDFERFLGAINYVLLKSIRGESKGASRNPKEGVNFMGRRNSTTWDGPEGISYVAPIPEIISPYLGKILLQLKAYIQADDFQTAASYLYESLVVLQPFYNANKQLARACYYAIVHAGETQPTHTRNIATIIREDFAGRTVRADLKARGRDALDRFEANSEAVIQEALKKHWGEVQTLRDSRELAPGSPWAEKRFFPESRKIVTSLSHEVVPSMYPHLANNPSAIEHQSEELFTELDGYLRVKSDEGRVQYTALPALITIKRHFKGTTQNPFLSGDPRNPIVDTVGLIRALVGNIETNPEARKALVTFIEMCRLIGSRALDKSL